MKIKSLRECPKNFAYKLIFEGCLGHSLRVLVNSGEGSLAWPIIEIGVVNILHFFVASREFSFLLSRENLWLHPYTSHISTMVYLQKNHNLSFFFFKTKLMILFGFLLKFNIKFINSSRKFFFKLKFYIIHRQSCKGRWSLYSNSSATSAGSTVCKDIDLVAIVRATNLTVRPSNLRHKQLH